MMMKKMKLKKTSSNLMVKVLDSFLSKKMPLKKMLLAKILLVTVLI